MRFLAFLAGLWLAGSAAHAQAPNYQWEKVNEFYVTRTPSIQYGAGVSPLFISTCSPYTASAGCHTNWYYATNTWHKIDLKPHGVAADAKVAFLTGLMIITHGSTQETADAIIGFRKPGDTSATCGQYIGQVTEAHIGGGQRSGLATWVPLENGEFEFCWRVSTPGLWPQHSSYGLNLAVQAWGR